MQWAQEAWAAYQAYDAVTRQAFAAPAEGWADQLGKVTVSPRLGDVGLMLQDMVQNSVVQVGFYSYELSRIEASSVDRVELVLCSDATYVAANLADGTPVPVDKSNPRTLVRSLVVRDSEGLLPWLVAEFGGIGGTC